MHNSHQVYFINFLLEVIEGQLLKENYQLLIQTQYFVFLTSYDDIFMIELAPASLKTVLFQL